MEFRAQTHEQLILILFFHLSFIEKSSNNIVWIELLMIHNKNNIISFENSKHNSAVYVCYYGLIYSIQLYSFMQIIRKKKYRFSYIA